MEKIQGRCSIFGGTLDVGMSKDSGLALYEPWEADLRPDIFLPSSAGQPLEATWKRLRTAFPYIALRFDTSLARSVNQTAAYKIMHPKTCQFVIAFLVDFGPSESTGRIVDVSPGIAAALRLQTDDEVFVEKIC